MKVTALKTYQFKVALVLLGIMVFSAVNAQVNNLEESNANIEPPEEPSITISPDYFDPIGEILYIEGRAEPNALITVVLQKPGDRPVEFKLQADSSGEWALAKKVYLKSGNWEVRARQEAGNLVSGWSNPRIIQSQATGVNVLGINVRYAVIAIVVLLALALVVGAFLYSVRKIEKARAGMFKRQMHEAEGHLHRTVTEIRKDLVEKEKTDHVLKDLEKLEKDLDEDLGNIEDKG